MKKLLIILFSIFTFNNLYAEQIILNISNTTRNEENKKENSIIINVEQDTVIKINELEISAKKISNSNIVENSNIQNISSAEKNYDRKILEIMWKTILVIICIIPLLFISYYIMLIYFSSKNKHDYVSLLTIGLLSNEKIPTQEIFIKKLIFHFIILVLSLLSIFFTNATHIYPVIPLFIFCIILKELIYLFFPENKKDKTCCLLLIFYLGIVIIGTGSFTLINLLLK